MMEQNQFSFKRNQEETLMVLVNDESDDNLLEQWQG